MIELDQLRIPSLIPDERPTVRPQPFLGWRVDGLHVLDFRSSPVVMYAELACCFKPRLWPGARRSLLLDIPAQPEPRPCAVQDKVGLGRPGCQYSVSSSYTTEKRDKPPVSFRHKRQLELPA